MFCTSASDRFRTHCAVNAVLCKHAVAKYALTLRFDPPKILQMYGMNPPELGSNLPAKTDFRCFLGRPLGRHKCVAL